MSISDGQPSGIDSLSRKEVMRMCVSLFWMMLAYLRCIAHTLGLTTSQAMYVDKHFESKEEFQRHIMASRYSSEHPPALVRLIGGEGVNGNVYVEGPGMVGKKLWSATAVVYDGIVVGVK